ncbi:MAG: ABC-F family ATP-binding cassette domain-containing protein [Ruminococcus sp.]|nr:ABC-F family ATP-binding cassette domain-containing protein [Ruminococcus sp.]
MLISIENLWKYFGGEPLLRGIDLSVSEHETVGLVGSNGCGKSTLLKIITGELGFDKTADGQGSVSVNRRARLGYLAQNSGLESSRSIIDELKSAFDELNSIKARMEVLEKQMTEAHADELEVISGEYAELSAFFEARDGYRTDVRINTVLGGMGFADVDVSRPVSSLSGGEKTRLALAKLLLEEPDLLILDEPTNHLDLATLTWLEDWLKAYKGAILAVSHDRYFLNKLCTRICEIENGRLTSYKGDYSAYLVQKKQNTERALKEYDAQQREIEKLEDYIARNKVRASTAKMAKSRQNALDRIERIERPKIFEKPPKIKLEYDIEPTKDILKVSGCPLEVGTGASKRELIPSLDLHIRRGDHAAIIGPNGIGKTSLLKMIQDMIPHSRGTVQWGGNVKRAYFDQEHADLDPRQTALETLTRRFLRVSDQQARSTLGAVLISGEDVFKPVSVLSGGERAKLSFAVMALTRGNVLVLDEPTNHIDLGTKEVLEDALAEFPGTIILVSHDRYLINKVAGRVIELSREGARSFEGNYDSYAEVKAAERQAAEAQALEEKQAKQLAEFEANRQKQYRSKQQRAEDAKRRARVRELENEIEELEQRIAKLEEEISLPETAADHELLIEKCAELDTCRTDLDLKMDEWAELS